MTRTAVLAACLSFACSGLSAAAMNVHDSEVDMPSVLAVMKTVMAGLRGQPSVQAAEAAPLYAEQVRARLSPEELGRLMLLARAAASGGKPFLEAGILRKHMIAFPGLTPAGEFARGRPGWIEFHAKDEGGELHFQVSADGAIAPWIRINSSTYGLETGSAQQAIAGELAVWFAKAASLPGQANQPEEQPQAERAQYDR